MDPDILNQHLAKTLSRGRVAATAPAGCPDISLYLFDPRVLEGPLSHEEAQAVVAEPAYWSFCWASGQVLAAYILANPHLVKGRKVMDFGSGSGVVAIAAAMAGAREAIACDIDPAALDAAAANARLNGVSVSLCNDWHARPQDVDVVTAADVLYDPENRPLLSVFRHAASSVLLADSRLRNLGDDHYRQQEMIEARTWPDLNEFEEFNRVRVYLVEQACIA
ncbi:50S ribosomal protein L11 methyltransferase [Marinobacter sp. 71-i]|uniref:50S ribosomal protein L11 methyltransferase n=1 Tax=Marinobacter iranensis TaxID=2962607 RepID=A0ABT5Y6K3_9GAMM|nr:50S ribosomal protein L11 methyltransferase [Marinobacter iranensis]MDF0749258.1 50S ribosomal protein L11 methyltransferase [Marinobacter iranensis]